MWNSSSLSLFTLWNPLSSGNTCNSVSPGFFFSCIEQSKETPRLCRFELMAAILALLCFSVFYPHCATRPLWTVVPCVIFLFHPRKRTQCDHSLKSHFNCHLPRWLFESVFLCVCACVCICHWRSPDLVDKPVATYERWSSMCHRAALPLHHKDLILSKDIHAYIYNNTPLLEALSPSNHMGSYRNYLY